MVSLPIFIFILVAISALIMLVIYTLANYSGIPWTAVILGGGVAKAGDLLLNPLREKVQESTFAAAEIGIPKLRLAQAGNDAGIIGAAMLEKYGMDRRKQ